MSTLDREKQQTTPVILITRHHRYTGFLVTRGYRVAEVLNDATTDVLEMHDTLASAVRVPSTDFRCPRIFLKKDSVLAAIPKGSHEAPLQRRNNYVEKNRFKAVFVLPTCILSGVVHLSRHTPASLLLAENSPFPKFIGVTNATLFSSTGVSAPLGSDVVIVQRQSVESVQLASRPLPTTPKEAEEGSPAGHPADGRTLAERS